MSSGFVSGGTIEDPKERDAEWLKAQEELEQIRRKKAEEGKQDGGKSLYEILQQNKSESFHIARDGGEWANVRRRGRCESEVEKG